MPVNSFENYPMSWKPDITSMTPPLYKSLASALEEDISKGILKPGDKLPPQRELADFLDINLSTITRAFKICELKGLISGHTGRGTYISSDVHISSKLLCSDSNNSYIDMGAAYPIYEQNKYIIEFMKKIFKKTNIDNLLKYAEPCGLLSHRIIAQKYLKNFNINTCPENIMISSGSQNALAIILTSLFNPGDKIATDHLTYPALKTLANALGIRLIPLPLVKDKIDFKAFDSLCKNENLKGIYLIPELNNPTTHSMTLNEKKNIAHLIKENNLIFIEDGIYSFVAEHDSMPIASLIPEQSLYICSVSKSLCAGLRIGFMVIPDKFKVKVEEGIYNINLVTSPFNAEIVCQMIESGLANKILKERKEMTLKRNEIVDEILRDNIILGNKYSPFRWLNLPENMDSQVFENAAKIKGVKVYCASRFAVGNSNFAPAVRLSICSPKNISELKKGLHILNTLL